MIRTYGKSPFGTAVLHGGPGGIGSAAELARGLQERYHIGTLEPLQSQYSIGALIDELEEQLNAPENQMPIVLIGHSWGAWLAGLFAEKHLEVIRKLILVGSGPLRPTDGIDAVRASRFTPAERAEYGALTAALGKCPEKQQDALLKRLGEICEKADTFCPAEIPAENGSSFDGEMYAKVWNEAEELRAKGGLEKAFRRLRVPVTIIHGDYDPHPADGVSRILDLHQIPYQYHLLNRCGHTPWREKYAADSFFEILYGEISASAPHHREFEP